MCKKCGPAPYCGDSGRRNFLKIAAAATVLGLAGGGFVAGSAPVPINHRKRKRVLRCLQCLKARRARRMLKDIAVR